MIVRVEAEKLDEFYSALPSIKCQPTGRTRRIGKDSDGSQVKDIEIEFPRFWNFSMSDAIYGLPGVRLMFDRMCFSRSWRAKLEEFVFWKLSPSGAE